MAKLLVVENESVTLTLLATLLKGEEHEVVPAGGGEEALKLLEKQAFDLMLSDIRMSPMDGLELLRRSRAAYPSMPVIMLTAFGTVSTAVDALKLGAFDYLTKPFKVDELLSTVRRALEYNRALRENAAMKAQLEARYRLENIVAESPSMQKVCDMIKRVAPTDATVLVTGEKGVGKKLVARAIHAGSPRKDKLFLACDCSSLPETLLESELFGHIKGALDGAGEHKAGLFETAEGGTVLLENVEALSESTQEKLLHFLQEHEINRVGSLDPIKVNVRLLVTTTEDFRHLITGGRFREDLYYRLAVISIDIEPLRKRPEDILAIVATLLRKESASPPTLSRDAAEALEAYDWPGNSLQLESCIKQALTLGDRKEIKLQDLPTQIQESPRKKTAPSAGGSLATAASLKAFLKEKEREYLDQVLKSSGGNMEAAAKKLNISVADLQKKLPG